MTRLKKDFLLLFAFFMFWALLFLGHNWEEGMKMDGLTNSILAKHILATKDWKIFHYTRSHYPDYYPHPPFAIWMEAIAFKIFGISDSAARIAPALFGLGTAVGVFFWGLISGSVWQGYAAALILLTSSRFIKYGSDAFLEGPLSFWMVWGAIAYLLAIQKQSRMREIFYSCLFGICTGMAFLTKTAFAFSLPLAVVVFIGIRLFQSKNSKERKEYFFQSCRIGLTGGLLFFVVLLVWFCWGDGWSFLKNHWLEIRDRVGTTALGEHLDPLVNLGRTYWPWFPVLIYSLFKKTKNPSILFAGICGFVIFSGLTWTGHFFEHYFLPFYPMAAVWLSPLVGGFLSKHESSFKPLFVGMVFLSAVSLAIFPIRLHSTTHSDPIGETLIEIQKTCQGQQELVISENIMEKWMGLAVALWMTPYEVTFVQSSQISPDPKNILILHSKDPAPPSGWEPISLPDSRFRGFKAQNGVVHCEKQSS